MTADPADALTDKILRWAEYIGVNVSIDPEAAVLGLPESYPGEHDDLGKISRETATTGAINAYRSILDLGLHGRAVLLALPEPPDSEEGT